MKVVGYVRVSLDSPVDDVLDWDEQERAIEAWALDNGHRVVKVFGDEGETASTGIESRLGLADALEALRAGEAQALAVARLERLAPDLIVQEALLADIARLDGRLFSAVAEETRQLADAPADPARKLVREVLRTVPVHERLMRDLWVRQRVRRLPRDDDTENAAMARIEQLAEQGMEPRQIATALSAEGFRPKMSHVFDLAGLRRIVAHLAAKRWDRPAP